MMSGYALRANPTYGAAVPLRAVRVGLAQRTPTHPTSPGRCRSDSAQVGRVSPQGVTRRIPRSNPTHPAPAGAASVGAPVQPGVLLHAAEVFEGVQNSLDAGHGGAFEGGGDGGGGEGGGVQAG